MTARDFQALLRQMLKEQGFLIVACRIGGVEVGETIPGVAAWPMGRTLDSRMKVIGIATRAQYRQQHVKYAGIKSSRLAEFKQFIKVVPC